MFHWQQEGETAWQTAPLATRASNGAYLYSLKNLRAGLKIAACGKDTAIRHQEGGRVIPSADRHARHRRPLLGLRVPQFGAVDGRGGVIEAGPIDTAGDEDLAIGEDGRVHLPTRVGHRIDDLPAWICGVEVMLRCRFQ